MAANGNQRKRTSTLVFSLPQRAMPLTGQPKKDHSRANYLRGKGDDLSDLEAQELSQLEFKFKAIYFQYGLNGSEKV